MECHDVQQLLAFVNRTREELDAPERAALHEHLERCPDCTAALHAERRTDEALGPLLRDVPAPADLKQKVLKRLALERGQARWKALKRASWSAAAAVLLVVLGGTAWHFWALPEVTDIKAMSFAQQGAGWSSKQVEHYFAEQGLPVKPPRHFDYRYLRHIEIVQFEKRQVAKLSFQMELENGQVVKADVLILPKSLFRVDRLPTQDVNDVTNLRFFHEQDFSYLVYYRGDVNAIILNDYQS